MYEVEQYSNESKPYLNGSFKTSGLGIKAWYWYRTVKQ